MFYTLVQRKSIQLYNFKCRFPKAFALIMDLYTFIDHRGFKNHSISKSSVHPSETLTFFFQHGTVIRILGTALQFPVKILQKLFANFGHENIFSSLLHTKDARLNPSVTFMLLLKLAVTVYISAASVVQLVKKNSPLQRTQLRNEIVCSSQNRKE